MAHTAHDKKKLLQRVSRLRGQVNALEKALNDESDCSEVLQLLAACRGAINALMAEVMEGHIQFHILDPEHKPSADQQKAADEVIEVIRRYLK